MKDVLFHAPRRAALMLISAPLLPLAPLPMLAADPPPDTASGVSSRSGLRFIDFRKGEGPSPRFGQLIRFHYVGYALDGESDKLKVFDSTYERKLAYFTKHGNGFTCQGIEEALHTMQPGGRRRVILPPNLGYAIGDKGPVPPNAGGRDRLYAAVDASKPLVFDLELVSAVDDLLDRGDYDDLDLEGAQQFAKEKADARAAAETGDGPMGRGT